MVIINQYSMLWSAIIILGLVVFFVLRRGFKRSDSILLFFIVAALLAGWLVLRPKQATTAEYAHFQSELGQGQAVLLELQSPF